MTLKQKGAVEVLRTAHERINKLLEGYDSKLSASDKEKLLADVSYELSVLAVLETEVFYPAIDEADGVSKVDHLIENHDHIKVLIAQNQRLLGDEPEFDTHIEELSKSVRKHMKDEEETLFSKLDKSAVDLEKLGEGMDKRRADMTTRPGD